MRVSLLSKLFLAGALLSLSLTGAAASDRDATPTTELKGMLPAVVGDFHLQGIGSLHSLWPNSDTSLEDVGTRSRAGYRYIGASGEKFLVEIVRAQSDSGAYALLTEAARQTGAATSRPLVKLNDIGTASFISPRSVTFYKGASFIRVSDLNARADDSTQLISLARLIADNLDNGSGEIPVLVKHLPDWEIAQKNAGYAIALRSLQNVAGNQPALDAISFDGGTEAVTAPYDSAGRLVIVEYSTPQLASEADARILARIAELRAGGKSVPSAYRRIGNYSVFVFDAPDETAASQLIDRVKYEKDVRWLGNNPRALERAERAYGEMTASVIITTLKATGLSILLCLGVGGILGSTVFMRRRAQSVATDAYTDAGGMMRLNIDDIAVERDPARLLEQHNK